MLSCIPKGKGKTMGRPGTVIRFAAMLLMAIALTAGFAGRASAQGTGLLTQVTVIKVDATGARIAAPATFTATATDGTTATLTTASDGVIRFEVFNQGDIVTILSLIHI